MIGRMRRIALVAATTVGCAAALAQAASSGAASTPPPRTAQDNQAAATNDAAALLALTPLPPGAAVMSSDPSGGELGMPAQTFGTPDLVDLMRWWLVPGQPDATFSFIKSHRPAGSKQPSAGYFVTGAGVTVRFVAFEWPPRHGVSDVRVLTVEETAAPNGQTALRADAQVVWVVPRPASERVPPGARVLTVSVKRPGKRVASITVTKLSIVRRLAATIDDLETTQPGSQVCPNFYALNDPPTITFTFRAVARGHALATAVESFAPRSFAATACNPIAFAVNGHPQRPLVDLAGSTIRTTKKLLGKLP